ncbi:MAG: hypothetical protein ACQ9MH_22710, partial [Nitrospinales bacterium]
MRKFNHDSFPHLIFCTLRVVRIKYNSFFGTMAAKWWGVKLGSGAVFNGRPVFRRHPGSRIIIGTNCRFNSSHTSNLIGVNRPCMFSTLQEGASVKIGNGCGFSGTVIGAAVDVSLGSNVRCGANTLITDNDWHPDDVRTKPPQPVV